MKKTILLYCPPPTTNKPSTRAPLALLAVSSMLVGDDYEIVILPRDPGQHRRIFRDYMEKALVYGVSVMTGPQIRHALKSSAAAREVLPDMPIIWGGWHPTIFPEQVAASPYVDIAVTGQGERVFTTIVDDLSKGRHVKKTLQTAPGGFVDINRFPSLPYEILNIEDYVFNAEMGSRTINYVSSRGCPRNCSYCAQQLVSGGRWYGLSPDRMIRDVERLKRRYAVDGILFDDANFFVDLDRVHDFAELLVEKRIKIGWGMANGRLEDLKRAGDSFWRLMNLSGMKSVFVGVEPRCGELTHSAGKTSGTLFEDSVSLAKKTAEAGITLKLSLLVGFPPIGKAIVSFDEELEEARSFLQGCAGESDKFKGEVSMFLPFPHAPLYKAAIDHGLKVPEDLEGWADWIPDKTETPWLPAGALKKIGEINEKF